MKILQISYKMKFHLKHFDIMEALKKKKRCEFKNNGEKFKQVPTLLYIFFYF